MSKPIVLPNTFSIDYLQLVYSSTRNPVFRQNLAVIRSVMKGFSTADICDIFMISETTFFNIVAKYREGGIDALDDQRTIKERVMGLTQNLIKKDWKKQKKIACTNQS